MRDVVKEHQRMSGGQPASGADAAPRADVGRTADEAEEEEGAGGGASWSAATDAIRRRRAERKAATSGAPASASADAEDYGLSAERLGRLRK
jgi:hypothetical protein